MAIIGTLAVSLVARTQNLERGMKRARDEIGTTTRLIQRASRDIKQALIGIFAVQAAANFGRALVSTAARLEDVNASLRFLLGSQEKATEAFKRTRDMARQMGVEFLPLIESFRGLVGAAGTSAFTMEEIERLFRAVTLAGRVLGSSTDQIRLAFFGLAQMMGSSNISMEEVRQVAEAIPGTMAIMARAVGRTTGEFREFIATGRVAPQQVLIPFARAIEQRFNPALDELQDRATSVFAEVKNAFTDMAEAFRQRGGTGIIVTGIRSIARAIQGLAQTVSSFQIVRDLNNANEQLERLLNQPQTPETIKHVERLRAEINRLTGELAVADARLMGRRFQSRVPGFDAVFGAFPGDEEFPKVDPAGSGKPSGRSGSKAQDARERAFQAIGRFRLRLAREEQLELDNMQERAAQAFEDIRLQATAAADAFVEGTRNQAEALTNVFMSPIEQAQATIEEIRRLQQTIDPETGERFISLEETARRAMDALQEKILEADTTLRGGFRRGLMRIEDDLTDMATSAERSLVGAFRSAEDAFVKFVQSGKVNFKSFADFIIGELARIAIRQAVLRPIAGALPDLLPGIFQAGSQLQGGGAIAAGAQFLGSIVSPALGGGGAAASTTSERPLMINVNAPGATRQTADDLRRSGSQIGRRVLDGLRTVEHDQPRRAGR